MLSAETGSIRLHSAQVTQGMTMLEANPQDRSAEVGGRRRTATSAHRSINLEQVHEGSGSIHPCLPVPLCADEVITSIEQQQVRVQLALLLDIRDHPRQPTTAATCRQQGQHTRDVCQHSIQQSAQHMLAGCCCWSAQLLSCAVQHEPFCCCREGTLP